MVKFKLNCYKIKTLLAELKILIQVNHKTLLELNRELTPFDLPALSPLPQVSCFTIQIFIFLNKTLHTGNARFICKTQFN